jgi:uncharacterized protein YbjT (DUF2867 family)/membrane protease YdiL (CAAX protease family)
MCSSASERGSGGVIAIAGGTGFIGRHVVARLLAAGHAVVVLARGKAEPIAGVEMRRCDLSRGVSPELLAGCRTLINLVGIKRPTANFGFEAAHVELPRALADAAEAAGIERMIHVSVAGADRAGPYLESKRRGEQLLLERQGSLAITIVRPSVVYGRGDDMLRNLADAIRAAPVFPAPRGGRAVLAPIAVEDVAEGLLRCIERPVVGRSYDLVGPEQLSLRALIERVAASPSVAKRCLVIAAPGFVQRPIAGVLERVSDDPLITRAQLGLLAAGVSGDPEPARRELGLEPRALDETAIEHALAGFAPRLPSVRLVPDPRARDELARLGGDVPNWALLSFAASAIGGLLAGPWLIDAIWLRMAVIDLVLLLAAISALRLRWSELLRPTRATTIAGLSAGVIMWLGAFAVAALLSRVASSLWAEAGEFYAWADALPIGLALALLTLIVAGEEIIWRGALGIGLATRVGAWPAVLLSAAAFTLAHASIGAPLLLVAAALAGAAWTWLAIRTRSLWAPFVAHLLWDVSLLWLTPLA